ncbi:MAG: choice-of-anchor D domain-containing protein, partial [Acidobacteria bacterium]|nr:choice-of-anchor D domain-containing protein [Acidobacteriota bacterium]
MPVFQHRHFVFAAFLLAALCGAHFVSSRAIAQRKAQDFWQPLRPANEANEMPAGLPFQTLELANPDQQTAELRLDDGSVEGGGLQDNLIVVNRLTPPSYPATLQRVRILFPTFNNQPDPTGKAIKLLVATEGSGSGTAPAFAQYTQINTTVPGTSLTNFFELTIPNGPTITSGDFYIGYQASAPHLGVGFAFDTNNSNAQAQNRSYISLDNGASFSVIPVPTGGVSAIAMMRAIVTLPNVAVAPAIDVIPAALNFGNVSTSSSLDLPLTIRNTGAAALNVTALNTSNIKFSFLATTLPFTVAPGAQQIATVRFVPTAVQSESGTLTIVSNDPTRPSLTVPVSGAGFQAGSNAIPLTSGAAQNGQIAGAAQSGTCALSLQQFTIAVPAGVASLQLTLASAVDVDLYARFNTPVVLQGGQVAADFRAESLTGNETITISPTTTPALQAGTYYLAISNCTTATANFTRIATVNTNTAGQITEELQADDGSPENGLSGGGAFFVNRLTPSRYPSKLQRVRIFFAQFSGQPSPSNQQIRLLVFSNTSGNALPITPALMIDRMVTIPTITTAQFADFDITENAVITEGEWVIGFQAPNPANGVITVIDTSSTFQNRSFARANTGAAWSPLTSNAMIRAVSLSGTQPSCTYTIAPTSQTFTAAGGNGTVNITAATGCAWTAASNATWLSVTSGAAGSGNGAVGFTAAANTTTSSRTGTLTIAGQTFTVTQAAQACTY